MIKTNTLGLLPNIMYIQYVTNRKKLSLDYYNDQFSDILDDIKNYPIYALSREHNIDLVPYHFTLLHESNEILQQFLTFFTISLLKSGMIEKKEDLIYSINNNISSIYDIMNQDIEYLLAGISCMQYFFI